jgi:hypothetical protein
MAVGSAAALIGAGAARAMPGDAYDDTRYPDDASVRFEQPRTVAVAIDVTAKEGRVAAKPGEEVRVVFDRSPTGGGDADLVLPDHGIRTSLPAGQAVAVTVRAGPSGGVRYVVEELPGGAR